MNSPTVPVSIVILTQDEEVNLGPCLDSLTAFDDIHVLDSGSTDGTIAIAQSRGIPVHHHPFAGFGQQRNWAIDNIDARYPWQFQLDADERMTPELGAELAQTIATDPLQGGYFIASKLIFCDRWLRYAGGYPTYQVRFFHRDRLRFYDHGHGQREQTRHPVGKLTQPYLHLAFAKGLDEWFAKHAVYARREAEQVINLPSPLPSTTPTSPLAIRTRRALKQFTSRMPFRYFLRLTYMLLLKRAFLDGAPGVIYSHMLASYESMIDVHLRLLRFQRRKAGGGFVSS